MPPVQPVCIFGDCMVGPADVQTGPLRDGFVDTVSAALGGMALPPDNRWVAWP